MRGMISGGIAALSFLVSGEVFAACTWIDGTPVSLRDISVPSQLTITASPVGGEIAKYSQALWPITANSRCKEDSKFSQSIETALRPASQAQVYETGVAGVGVKFCIAEAYMGVSSYCLPQLSYYSPEYPIPIPKYMNVIFVRTGRNVASGDILLDFKSLWQHEENNPNGKNMLTIQSQGKTKLVNDVMFAGCESIGAVVNVPMGKQVIQNIKTGNTKEVPFIFDVRCSGLPANTTAPVKVYFEGASLADGLLKLSNQGQSGVASGVGISLVNDKGVKLPFDIARSVQLDWNRSMADGEIYRFSGKAKYVPTTGTMTAGKADATMNFVLNYN
ncbi:fimbrial protein [Pseudomonas sp. MRSN 12121]|uniref:fimbrial protein n=1 Tax=Pseudomonas sp. MRSN 12121 TaxID=1611770 RepID=UPI0005BEB3C5|nr:fimbrial protein [Pseudomonas sp. MRSN 12121]AJO77391.1 fimbrial protein [Pseudomonas sp. MRSN 12121]